MIKLRNGLFVVLGPLLIAATLYGGLISFLELREIGDDTVLAVSGTPVTLAFAAIAVTPLLLVGYLAWWVTSYLRRPGRRPHTTV